MAKTGNGWGQLRSLLPPGWDRKARELKAFERSRRIQSPEILLRTLLFHAISGTGLRLSARRLELAGIARLSAVALLLRLRASGPWLSWIAAQLFQSVSSSRPLHPALRPRVVDGTAIQRPGSRSLDWRLHYTIDLSSLDCDWFELSETGAENLWRVPVKPGDVLVADRYFFTQRGAAHIHHNGGFLLIRLRWKHPTLLARDGRRFFAFNRARRLKVSEIAEWNVQVPLSDQSCVDARVVATRLPASKTLHSKAKLRMEARRKGRHLNSKTLESAHLVMLLTTLPRSRLSKNRVMQLDRFRWQIELTFKRLKQLLQLGHLPHKDVSSARALITAKLIVALLIDRLLRETNHSFRIGAEPTRSRRMAQSQPLEMDAAHGGRSPRGALPSTVFVAHALRN